jgi:hypothetical protein
MKKSTLLLVSLFATAYTFAQLNVRNNAFVYVKDEVVFVENNVNLQESTANFYLRDEAQLIQGNQTISNAGSGDLSQLEAVKSDFFGYNGWSLPVSGNNGAVINPSQAIFSNTGTVADGFTTFGAVNYISPYSPSAAPSQTEISRYWLWGYDLGTQYADWKYLGNLTTLHEAGKGFLMKGASLAAGNTALDYRGLPNSGDITVPVSSDQSTLVGNPYPSALDARDFIHDTNNIGVIKDANIFYYYHPGSGSHNIVSYQFAYAAYTINAAGTIETKPAPALKNADITGDNATNAGTNVPNTAERYIPISQGFFVDGASGIPGGSSVRFTNSQRDYVKRSASNSTTGYRTTTGKSNGSSNSQVAENLISYNSNGYSVMPGEYKRFRFNVTFVGAQFNRELIHTFNEELTDGPDYGYETRMSPISNADAYFLNQERTLNGMADTFDVDMKIPFVLKTTTDQLVSFHLTDIQNFDTDQPIYLHDKNTDEYFNIRNNEHQMTFAANDYTGRFEITFKNNDQDLSIIEDELNSFNIFQNNNAQALTLLNPKRIDVSDVSVYDVIGKQIFKTVNMNGTDRFEISTKSLSDAVYIVKVNFTNGGSTSKKVIVSNKN